VTSTLPRPARTAALARTRLTEAIAVKQALLADDAVLELTVRVADLVVASLRGGGTVLFCGNGGSSMDAGHLAAELTGRFAYDRPGLAAVNLADATAALTAIANDYSYADAFARMTTALGKRGDVLVGLSTSGNSANVVNALAAGREAGLVTVGLTGRDGGQLAAVAEHCLRVPSDDTARVQEACLHLGHTICELVEQEMFPRA
jgi:D-sedoheptulose 7-phosphate isomerase